MSDEAIAKDETPRTDDGPEAEAERPDPDETPLQRAERERDDYLEKYQRARADYQNLKRRTYEDIQAAVRRERSSLLEETLIVLDYLDMALAAPCESAEVKNLQVGVQMTRDQLWAMLERQGVSPIPTDGAFDPSWHQAVSTVETTEHEPGAIVEVVRRGFRMHDGVLRYAQVKVAAEAAPQEPSRQEPAEGSDPEEER